ncbi:MAG: hypothetical protein WCG34_01730 [Leptolinea sp.]
MKAFDELTSAKKSRLGFHYFPNTLHYSEKDADQWIPELQALGAGWLVLLSESDRAIPESFLSSLKDAQIEPIIQFSKGLEKRLETTDMRTLLEAYSRWGVRTISFFDRPNSRSSWPTSEWAQNGLVERFLDRYIPLASLALECEIIPLFPSLEPGGNFWDTAFLSLALQALARRNRVDILDQLVLSAYAWTHDKSLNWGAGGPERWADAKPYFTPPGEEDQKGFRAYEWYTATASVIVQKTVPVILMGAGVPHEPMSPVHKDWTDEKHTEICLAITQLLRNDPASDPEKPASPLEPVGNSVLAANFWLLSDDTGSPHSADAWYRPDGSTRQIVNELRTKVNQSKSIRAEMPPETSKSAVAGNHPIGHYLLLPSYEWGVADWHLDVIRPFVKKYKPTIGFSLEEATLANKITVIGNIQSFSDEQLESLRASGSQVERISGDGTSIATQLQER